MRQLQGIWQPAEEPPQEDIPVEADWSRHEGDIVKVPVAENASCSVGFSPSLY